MKKTMMTLSAAALLGLGACAHMDEEVPPAEPMAVAAPPVPPPRSEAQLAIDDAQVALKAADEEFARSGNSEETKRLNEVARQKIDHANAMASNEQCRERVSGLQAQFTGLQEQFAAAVTKEQKLVVPHFEFEKAELLPPMKLQLDLALPNLQGNDSTVVITGHTDDVGSEEVNQELALTRAAAGRDYLISKGIDASRIEIKSAGAGQPVAPNDTPENRAKNRRIEVVIKAIKPVS